MCDFVLRRTCFEVLALLASILICAQFARAQTRCLNDSDVQKMLSQVNSHQKVAFNKKLRDRLIKLQEKDEKSRRDAVVKNRYAEALLKSAAKTRDHNAAELCEVFSTFGWPSKDLVGQEGTDAAFYLLINSSSFEMQADLLPVVITCIKQGEISRTAFASYVDRLRLSAGLKQLFGTQVTISDGLLALFPIEAEAQVDTRREEYGLGPLAAYLRYLEATYRLPLIRSTGALTNSFSDTVKRSIADSSAALEGQTVAAGEVIRVDTNLVNLNVSVYSSAARMQATTLGQKDFAVSEDGTEQTISFFATADVPFDLVLLLDLSSSTTFKQDVIRKSTKRFIEAARASDRIAIVTFSDDTHVLAALTEDRAKLLNSVGKIQGRGGSRVWDALKFTLDQVLGPKTLTRRRAVVLMTDGVDNALEAVYRGSAIRFSDLLEAVRKNDPLIVPIYLETERKYSWSDDAAQKRIVDNARKTLALLADESGGLYYKARKIEDLEGVYQQVIDDLGKVYSLGYKPTNKKRDGSWRTVTIGIPGHPELKTRARPGYYATEVLMSPPP